MKKLILLISTIILILAQGFVLIRFFINKYDVILGGDTFKFLVEDIDFENAREKGYIDVNLVKKVSGIGSYGIMNIDKDGFAELSDVAIQKPNYGAYIESIVKEEFIFPFNKYYINPFIAPSKKLVLPEEYKAYIQVRIKDGKSELLKLMIDDENVEKYCK